jgi:hypothetical protein
MSRRTLAMSRRFRLLTPWKHPARGSRFQAPAIRHRELAMIRRFRVLTPRRLPARGSRFRVPAIRRRTPVMSRRFRVPIPRHLRLTWDTPPLLSREPLAIHRREGALRSRDRASRVSLLICPWISLRVILPASLRIILSSWSLKGPEQARLESPARPVPWTAASRPRELESLPKHLHTPSLQFPLLLLCRTEGPRAVSWGHLRPEPSGPPGLPGIPELPGLRPTERSPTVRLLHPEELILEKGMCPVPLPEPGMRQMLELCPEAGMPRVLALRMWPGHSPVPCLETGMLRVPALRRGLGHCPVLVLCLAPGMPRVLALGREPGHSPELMPCLEPGMPRVPALRRGPGHSPGPVHSPVLMLWLEPGMIKMPVLLRGPGQCLVPRLMPELL